MTTQATPAIAEGSINQEKELALEDIDFCPAPPGLAPYIGARFFIEAPTPQPIENTIW